MNKVNDKILINAQILRDFSFKLLKKINMDDKTSAFVTESLVQSDLRGVDTHGVVRLPTYIKRFTTIEWKNSEVIKDDGVTALIDGNNSPGQACAGKAMELAIEKADRFGVGLVGVKNSNHFGTAAFYTMKAAEEGMVGLSFTNASPRLAPWGGKDPLLGNNPWSFAFPRRNGVPVAFDISNSVVAAGKIRQASMKGEEIPIGWATDKEGNATQNAEEALKGLLLPIGGHKGYGITLVVDILSGILTGSGFARQINGIDKTDSPQNVGHLLGAIKISNFIPYEEFLDRMDTMTSLIKNSERAPGVEELYLPGEIEEKLCQERLKHGIPIPQKVIARLNEMADELGVDRLVVN